jgi:nicotinate-nucleotide adenylyltransferase
LKTNASDWISGQHRLRMCEIAIEGDSFFEVSDLELRRPPPSYTIDTVRELKRLRGWSEVNWLIGADNLDEISKWHEADALRRETNFVVMPRPASDNRQTDCIELPLIDISATDIRRRVRAGCSIKYLSPSDVCEYIRANGLYL